MTDLVVVVPVYNQVHLTKRCFASLLDGAVKPQEMVIIDNHSTDETPRYLEEFKRQAENKGWIVQIVSNPENRGVSAAWNQGIKASTSPYVAIVNNDTWLMPGWDESLLASIKRLDASMVGAYYDEDPFDEIKTPLKAKNFVARNRGKASPEWASILMFFDRRMFAKVGLFDERYFVTYEDRDMRERMDRAGLKYYKVADCFIWHHSKGTRDAGGIRPRYEEESLAKFIEKWGFDPRPAENSKAHRYLRKWTLLKNRWGYF